MAKLRVFKANGGKVVDLIKYKKEKEKREITEEVRNKVDQEIKKKRQQFTGVLDKQTVALSTGKRARIMLLEARCQGQTTD